MGGLDSGSHSDLGKAVQKRPAMSLTYLEVVCDLNTVVGLKTRQSLRYYFVGHCATLRHVP